MGSNNPVETKETRGNVDQNPPNARRTPSLRAAISNAADTPSKILTNTRPQTSSIQQPVQQEPGSSVPTRHPSVSFNQSESQERLRRFTISSQPSATNIATQENHPEPPLQPPSNTPSRQASLNRKRNNDALSFNTKPSVPAREPTPKFDENEPARLNTPSPTHVENYNAASTLSPTTAVPIKITGTGSNASSRRNSLKKASKTIVASPVGPPVPFQEYLSKEDDGKFHILLACTGSVATIKIPLIIDKLFQLFGPSKVAIQLIVTKAASHFLKGSKINADVKIWRDEDEWANYSEATTISSTQNQSTKPKSPFDKLILHNELRKWADIMLVAPLSANTLAKISNGIADNLLTSIIRSWAPSTSQQVKKPIIVAPAMNTFMYTHPMTAKQIATITSPDFSIEVLKPVEKVLVCGDIGMGGMRDWVDVVDILRRRILAIEAESKELSDRSIAIEEEGEEEDDDGDDEGDDEEGGEDDDDDDDEDDDDDDDEDEDDDDEEDDDDDGDDALDDRNEDGKPTMSSSFYPHDELELSHDEDGNEEMIFEITDQDVSDGDNKSIADSNLSPTTSHRHQKITIPKETQNII